MTDVDGPTHTGVEVSGPCRTVVPPTSTRDGDMRDGDLPFQSELPCVDRDVETVSLCVLKFTTSVSLIHTIWGVLPFNSVIPG